MGLLRCLYKCTRNFLVFFLLVVLIPGLPPKTHFPIEPITFAPALPLVGPLAPNKLLNNAERLFAGRLNGPECLRKRGNDLFASTADELVKINGDHVTHVARFGKPCEPHDPEICGRPLGFDFDTLDAESLIVADAYHGIWTVNTRTLRKHQLIAPDTILPGDIPRPAKIFNSVAIARNGDIYFTDSSSDFNLINGLQTFLINPSGRLFRYERATKKITVLADRLHFANGLVLATDESFVVVAESAASRLKRVWLRGDRRGQVETFADGLPGAPDNLSADREGLWVPLVFAFDPEAPTPLWHSAGPAPLVRTFLLRLIAGVQAPLRYLNQVWPNVYTKVALNRVSSFESVVGLVPQRTSVLRMSWSGEVVGSLSGQDGSAATVAHVLESDGVLWLGSFRAPWIGRVKLPKSLQFAEKVVEKKVVEPKVEAPKPKPVTTTTPKPVTTTTTTPKPTTTTTPKPTTTTKPTTTPKPVTTTTTPKPTTTTTTTPKPATTTTTAAPTTTTAKPTAAPKKPAAAAAPKKPAAAVPPPPPPPQQQQEEPRAVPPPRPIEEKHEEPTRPPPPPKMKVIKRGGEQGEF